MALFFYLFYPWVCAAMEAASALLLTSIHAALGYRFGRVLASALSLTLFAGWVAVVMDPVVGPQAHWDPRVLPGQLAYQTSLWLHRPIHLFALGIALLGWASLCLALRFNGRIRSPWKASAKSAGVYAASIYAFYVIAILWIHFNRPSQQDAFNHPTNPSAAGLPIPWAAVPLEWTSRHKQGVCAVALSPDGKRLATGRPDGHARVWNTETGKVLNTLRDHHLGVCAVAVTPDGNEILTGSYDGIVRLWDGVSGKHLHDFVLHTYARPSWPGGVLSLALSRDGRLAAAGRDTKNLIDYEVSSVYLFDLSSRTTAMVYPIRGQARATAISPDGRTLAAGSSNGSVFLWDLAEKKSGIARAILVGHTKPVNALAFSADGTTLFSAGRDGILQAWETATGKLLAGFERQGTDGEIYALALSPDGRSLATAGENGALSLWDMESRLKVRDLTGHHGPALAAVWSSDGRRIVSGGNDMTARLWDIAGGDAALFDHRPSTAILSAYVGLWCHELPANGSWPASIAVLKGSLAADSRLDFAFSHYLGTEQPRFRKAVAGAESVRLTFDMIRYDGYVNQSALEYDLEAEAGFLAGYRSEWPHVSPPQVKLRSCSDADLASAERQRPPPPLPKVSEGFGGLVMTAQGVKVAFAKIVFTSEDGKRTTPATSNAFGQYRVALPAGRYRVTASHSEYRPYSTGSGFFVSRSGVVGTGNIYLEPNPAR